MSSVTVMGFMHEEDKHADNSTIHRSPKCVQAIISKVPPPPSPHSLPTLVKDLKFDIGMDQTCYSEFLREVSSVRVKPMPADTDEPLEHVQKSAGIVLAHTDFDYKNGSSVSLQGETCIDHQKQLESWHMDNQTDSLQKAREILVNSIGKEIDHQCKSMPAKAAAGSKLQSQSKGIASEVFDLFPTVQGSATRADVAAKNDGSRPRKKKLTLCSECRAASDRKAICFVSNDGRLAACSARPSEYVRCKYHWCASNDPDYIFPPAVQTKKFLVSKRHSPKEHISHKRRNNKTPSVLSDQKRLTGNMPSHSKEALVFGGRNEAVDEGQDYTDDDSSEFNHESATGSPNRAGDAQTCLELGKHHVELGDEKAKVKISATRRGSHKGCAGFVHEQESETVKLRRQLMQERRQAEEWMIDNAIQKLAPTGERKVKILVEAFENILHNDLHWVGGPKHTLHNHIATRC